MIKLTIETKRTFCIDYIGFVDLNIGLGKINMTEYLGKTKFGDVEFTKDQITDYQEAFTQFDIDGDGTVTTQVNHSQNRGQKEIKVLNLRLWK